MKAAGVSIPSSAGWLGASGALPFIGLAVALPFISDDQRTFVAHALLAYGATIVSFLGGVHWGLAMGSETVEADRELKIRLTLSVVPSLLGWTALLVAEKAGFCILAAAFAAMFWIDIQTTRMGRAPPWYPKLRTPLTGVVVIAMLFGALV